MAQGGLCVGLSSECLWANTAPSSSLWFSLQLSGRKKESREKTQRHSRYSKSMTCSSWLYPMRAVSYAPCRHHNLRCWALDPLPWSWEASERKENQVGRGLSISSTELCAAGAARSLCTERTPSAYQLQGIGVRGCAWRHLTTGSSPGSAPELGTWEALRVSCGLPAKAPQHRFRLLVDSYPMPFSNSHPTMSPHSGN